jgi:spore coat polysaccharide biosynthesis protein SpsF
MLGILGIVDACFQTADIRAKASRRLGGKSVLEWVVRRMTDCQRLDGVIVVTNDDLANAFVSDLAPLDVPLFVSDLPHALGCMAAALDEYRTESAVLVGAASPFVDPVLVDRLVHAVETGPECDYACYSQCGSQLHLSSPVSVFAEWIRAEAVRTAARKARDTVDRDNPARYIYTRPDRFLVRMIEGPAGIDRQDIRLRFDMDEDWEQTVAIFDALGPEELSWQRIATLLDHQPHSRKREAALDRPRG